jgi:hypothetical protein
MILSFWANGRFWMLVEHKNGAGSPVWWLVDNMGRKVDPDAVGVLSVESFEDARVLQVLDFIDASWHHANASRADIARIVDARNRRD